MFFKNFVKNQAVDSKLPFELDFEIKPDFGEVFTSKVAGFELPTFNELLSREVWFFEIVGSQLGNRRQDLQIKLTLLSQELKTKCNLDRLGEAMSLLFGTIPPDLDDKTKAKLEDALNSPEYESFLLSNTSELQRLGEAAKLVEDDLTIDWLKVTFFLMSRYSGEWTLGKTAALTTSRIKQIVDFIELESNGGKLPSVEGDVVDPEDVGK